MHPNPFALAFSLSPVDLPEPLVAPPHPLRWTVTAIAVAAATLALLNAHAIRGWTYQLPASAYSARAVAAAESWYDAVGRLRLNAPVETMRAHWQAMKSGQAAGQETAESPSSRSARAYSSSATG